MPVCLGKVGDLYSISLCWYPVLSGQSDIVLFSTGSSGWNTKVLLFCLWGVESWEVEVPGTGAEDGEGQWLCQAGRNSLLLGRKMDQKADAFVWD